MIRKCEDDDIPVMLEIINDAARAFQGVIPGDCWSEPYMPRDELLAEIEDGVEFWGHEEAGQLIGIMGIQGVGEVTLIRHAYVRTSRRNRGVGSRLLKELRRMASGPILMGTWIDAVWAIAFYEKHGFRRLTGAQSARLLRRYWKISDRQVKNSVVLAERGWREPD
ncbi:MAG: GNAT family N-acetyltransferase [Thermoleophilia bacterium]|nr:GNAT family N-acetyltransferase [Thermoleophilia bacterium]